MNKKLSISFPEKLMEKIKERACSCDRTIPNYIKTILEFYLKSNTKTDRTQNGIKKNLV